MICALSSQVDIFGTRGEPLVLIKQIADYCDTHREKFALGDGDLFDEYVQKIVPNHGRSEPGVALLVAIVASRGPGGLGRSALILPLGRGTIGQ